jgi:hypothetical protein
MIALLTFLAAAGFAATDKYLSSTTLLPGHAANSGWNYWEKNWVYRPVGYTYHAYYYNSSGFHGLTINAYSNPFYAPGPYGYSSGYCENASGVPVYPTTCIVNTF